MKTHPSGWQSVYRVVRRIPIGHVATYGQVAALAGMPRAARQVGWALSALEGEDDVPWHRVINAKGEVSPRGAREYGDLQRARLESEGVEFDERGRVDLAGHGWKPGGQRSGAARKTRVENSKTRRGRNPRTPSVRKPIAKKQVANKRTMK